MYKIKNWEKFNLYNPKNPRYQKKWFKFYGTDYINNIEIHRLSFEQKAVLVELWCLGSESDGVLPDNFEIAFRLHYPIDFVEKIVKELFTRGLLVENYEPVTIEKNKSKIREDNIYVVKTTKRFEEFWESYPNVRKVNKKTCMERWANKSLDSIADEVIGYVKRMKDTQSWKDGFSPAPLTLLNQERWNDGEAPQERKVWEGGI